LTREEIRQQFLSFRIDSVCQSHREAIECFGPGSRPAQFFISNHIPSANSEILREQAFCFCPNRDFNLSITFYARSRQP
jgi:hypothetical protein